jgi:hypothetical protein
MDRLVRCQGFYQAQEAFVPIGKAILAAWQEN